MALGRGWGQEMSAASVFTCEAAEVPGVLCSIACGTDLAFCPMIRRLSMNERVSSSRTIFFGLRTDQLTR